MSVNRWFIVEKDFDSKGRIHWAITVWAKSAGEALALAIEAEGPMQSKTKTYYQIEQIHSADK